MQCLMAESFIRTAVHIVAHKRRSEAFKMNACLMRVPARFEMYSQKRTAVLYALTISNV